MTRAYAKAMILAAGKGTRVQPLTHDMPKPMIPILGKPVMEYLVEHLAAHGIREIMVNVSHLHDQIESYFGDGQRFGVEIGYSFEGELRDGHIVPQPIGSAGGVRKIEDFGGFFDTTTLVLCGDALIDLDFGAVLAEHRERGAEASIVTAEVPWEAVSDYGVVVADAHGRIESFQEKPSRAEARSNWASTGIYVFEPAAVARIPQGRVYDIGGELFPDLVAGGAAFYAQRQRFNWIDIGKVSDYWHVCQRVMQGEVAGMRMPGRQTRVGVWEGLNVRIDAGHHALRGPVYLGSGCHIEAGARISGPTWIGHGCHIEAGAQVERCVLFPYTRVAAGAHFTDAILSGNYCVDRHGEMREVDAGWGDSRERRT